MANEIADPIVDRLKAEGQLTRNTGTNSIRSVKIQLDRFESIFDVISENITAQTEMMAKSLDLELDKFKISQETAEREKAKEQIEELNRDQEQENDKKSKDKEESKKEKEGLFSLLGGLGLKNLLIGGALLGGGLFALYNFAKGYVDEQYDNAWSNAEDSILEFLTETDWKGVRQDMADMVESLSSISAALQTLLEIIQGFIDNPWSLFALGLGLGFGPGRIGRMIGRGLGGLFGRGATGAAGGGFFRAIQSLSRFMFGAAGAPLTGAAATTAVLGYGAMTKRQLEEEFPEARGLNNGAGFGVVQLRYLIENDLLNEAIEEAIRNGTYRMPGGGLGTGDTPPSVGDVAPPIALGDAGDIDLDELIDLFELERFLESIPEALDDYVAPETSTGGGEDLGGEEGGEQLASAREVWNQIREMRDEQPQGPERVRLSNLMNQINVSSTTPEDAAEILAQAQNGGGEEAPAGGDVSFRRGTRGFQDFGEGTFSILHGREAVVPSDTAAGRFLEQFFNDDWTPKIGQANNMAERVATATAGGIFNMPVIINNSPVNAPTINNVQGAPSLSSVNYFGGGGGSQSGVYGLPRAMN